jgi:hypothetical protein
MKNIFISLVIALVFFASCKNDIQLNADYKEIAVVYGLLDINDSVHYIRIERAYQNTNATAKDIAQKPDSLYFDSLDVKITDISTNPNNVYTLHKEMSVIKDSGYFQNKLNILYGFTNTIFATHVYRLDVKNIYTGNAVTSQTIIVGNPQQVTSPAGDTFDLLPAKKIKANFRTGINARSYDVFYRFKYDEFDSVTNILQGHKYVDYYVARGELTLSFNGGEDKSLETFTEDIIQTIGNGIPVKRGIYRVATFFDAYYAGAADDLNVYLDVSKPSIGIVQKKPEFTNVTNGYGIFSSRNVFVKKHPVNTATQKTLREHPATSSLGFK